MVGLDVNDAVEIEVFVSVGGDSNSPSVGVGTDVPAKTSFGPVTVPSRQLGRAVTVRQLVSRNDLGLTELPRREWECNSDSNHNSRSRRIRKLGANHQL